MTTGVRVTPPGRSLADWSAIAGDASPWSFDQLVQWCRGAGRRPPPRLLAISAHPDDETIGAGRLLAAWSAAGLPSDALLATCGEACFDHVLERPAELAEQRTAEWHDALDELGVGARLVVGLADGELEEAEPALVSAATQRAAALLDDGPVVLVAPYRHDPHPDHRAAGRAAALVASALGLPLLEYPIWLSFWSDPALAPPQLRRVTLSPAAEQSRERALRHFVSQLQPWQPGLDPVVPAELLQHHRDQLVLPTPEPQP